MTDTYGAYLNALATADAGAAVAALDRAVASGQSRPRLIKDVLARAQRQVGQLWMHGEWSIADEHAATAVAEQALTVIAPPRIAPPGARRIVLACAEGEWHTLPARLAGELARSAELDVVMLGGSIPAAHLRQHLRATPPAALALSVTMPTNLIGASRSIQAARDEGIPVIVGGAAWGTGQHRARRLGADVRLDDAEQLRLFIDNIGAPAPRPESLASIPAEALLLDVPQPELLVTALERQSAANAWMRSMTASQRDQALQDFGWLARFAAASVACDDPTIVRQVLAWLLALLVPRGVPAEAIVDSCSYLADVVEDVAPAAAHTLRREAARARSEKRRQP